jgi:septal ring factor EnvC (AmiA/AmiB activator)
MIGTHRNASERIGTHRNERDAMKLLTQHEIEQLRNASRYDGQPKTVSGKFARLSDSKAAAGKALVGSMRGRPTPAEPTVKVYSQPDPALVADDPRLVSMQTTIDAQATTIADLERKLADAHARIATLETPIVTIESPVMASQADAQVEAETPKQRYDRLNKAKRAEAARLRRSKLASSPL